MQRMNTTQIANAHDISKRTYMCTRRKPYTAGTYEDVLQAPQNTFRNSDVPATKLTHMIMHISKSLIGAYMRWIHTRV